MLTQKQSNSRTQAAEYRQFSRRRYSELKAKSRKLREPEIVTRVMREWEGMSNEQRQRYLKIKEEAMVPLNVEGLATPQKEKINKANQKTTVEKKTQKMEMKEQSSMSLDEINIKQFEESSSSKLPKSKKITKNKSDYISFFRYYFKKLHEEHPKWNCRQTTIVIKLLWQKRKTSQKSVKMRPIKLAKPISGRKAFMKSSKLPKDEVKKRWGRLPRETRMKWMKIGNPSLEQKSMNMSKKATIVLSSKMTPNSMSNLNFLQKMM